MSVYSFYVLNDICGYNYLFPVLLQNDISDVLDLTFSIDADEEKLILYERNEVWSSFSKKFLFLSLFCFCISDIVCAW